MTTSDYAERFGGLQRLYGDQGFELLKQLNIAVVGIGGVGSWAAEALARSGVGNITLIDFDEICLTNTNRQVHAVTETVGLKKVEVMAERIGQINPECRCTPIVDFLTMENYETLLSNEYDYVIDAIDSIKFKSVMIYYCKRNKIPIITTGGAGGRNDPTMIQVADLSRTYNDALAAKVRSQLRSQYNFTRNAKRSFGVECVFSSQQPVYPKDDGTVSHAKPGIHGISLDCRFGYGAFTPVTASFGMIVAARAINKSLARRIKNLK